MGLDKAGQKRDGWIMMATMAMLLALMLMVMMDEGDVETQNVSGWLASFTRVLQPARAAEQRYNHDSQYSH